MGLDFSKSSSMATPENTQQVQKKDEIEVVEQYDIVSDRQQMNTQLVGSQEVDDIVSTIEVNNLETIVSFGSEVAEEISKASDVVLNSMSTEKIEYFNIINCSFLLIHLKNAVKVLKELKRFLAPDGCIIVIEPDDTESYLSPDTDGIFKEFLKVLEYDPYSGKRTFGSELPQLFNESGYLDYRLRCSTICAKGDEISKKEAIFTTFCSYLKEDLMLLREQEPENNIYQECWEWVTRNFDKLHNYMISEKAKVCMGVKIYTCGGMANEHRRIDTNSIDT